jgi:hypothetical protein
MRRVHAWLLLFSLAVITGTPRAVSQEEQVLAPMSPRKPLGIWESDDGEGGAVGINLWEVPSSMGHGGPLPAGDDGNRPVLQVGVYQRRNTSVHCGEENFYDTGWRGSNFGGVSTVYTQDLLTIHNPAKLRHDVPLDLDLKHDPIKDVWVGRFHRGMFDMNLILHRVANRPSHDQEICTTPSAMAHSMFP